MKKMFQKVISILLVTILLLPSAVFAQEPEGTTEEVLQETIFYAEKSCTIEPQTNEATGSVIQVVENGDINVLPSLNHRFMERANEIDEIQSSLFSNTVSRVEQDTYSQSTTYYTANQLALNAVVLSKENLIINASVIQAKEDDFAVLVSQQGDVTLSATNLTYQGIIYAPNGTVSLSASNLDFKGVIIAENIVIKTANITFSYDNRVEEYLSEDSEEEPLPDGVEIYEKPLNPNDILVDEATGVSYVKGQILLTATESVTKVEVANMIKSYEGRIVGYISVTNDYQIVLENAETKAELDPIMMELESNSQVESVLLHWVFENEYTGTAPNDPWLVESDGPNGWDENNPNGTNWGLEATKVLSAWEDKDQMQSVKVGVIDSGVWEHNDLQTRMKLNTGNTIGSWEPPVVNPKDPPELQRDTVVTRNHGTHVAGIIGATINNGKGISGIAPNTDIYAVATLQAQAFTTKRSLAELIVREVKVINYSIGRSYHNSISDLVYNYEQLKEADNVLFSSFLKKFINNGYDFLIVQGSCNNSNIKKDADKQHGWVDSRYGGHFNSLEDEEVNDHIIVVGAYGTTGNQQYHIWERSQIGSRVDALAPGEQIASLMEGNETMYMSGTSQAAPHVSGVAAMVWGINPSLTAKQVKEVLIGSATTTLKAINDESAKNYFISEVEENTALNRVYPLLNAKAAVERAKQISGGGSGEPKDKGVLMGKLTFPQNVAVKEGNYPEIKIQALPIEGGITGKHPEQIVKSDAEGEFSFVLPEGDYIINIVSESFELHDNHGEVSIYPFSMQESVKSGEVKYLETVQLIQRFQGDEQKTMKITGAVRDALNDSVVTNADIYIQRNWGVETEFEEKKSNTGTSGSFMIDLPLGYYTVIIKKDGYINAKYNIAVSPENNPSFKFVITPKLNDDEIRIVLTWGQTPRDLDSHFIGYREGGLGSFHVYCGTKSYIDTKTDVRLDHDIVRSYGPETITVKKRNNQKYIYYVYNFSGPNNKPIGQAQVMVYWGNDNVSKFIIPPQQMGRYWTVFELEGDTITPINSVSESDPRL